MAEISKERKKTCVRGRLKSHLTMENIARGKGERDTRKCSRIRELREKGESKQANIHANQKKAKIRDKKTTKNLRNVRGHTLAQEVKKEIFYLLTSKVIKNFSYIALNISLLTVNTGGWQSQKFLSAATEMFLSYSTINKNQLPDNCFASN